MVRVFPKVSHLVKGQVLTGVESTDVLGEGQGRDVGLRVAGPAPAFLPGSPRHRARPHLGQGHEFVTGPGFVAPKVEEYKLRI